MKHFFILVFAIVYIFFGNELGYTSSLPVWKHITYNFQHATPIHLLMNSVSFYFIFRVLERYLAKIKIISIALFVAFATSFLCRYDKPVVGASGMIYAMLGIYLYLIFKKTIQMKNKQVLIIMLLSIAMFLAIGFFKHNTAALLHLLCLAGGFFMMYVKTPEKFR